MRAAVAALTHPHTVLQNDDLLYAKQAAALLATGALDTGDFVRPPVYFLLVAGVQWLTPHWLAAAKLLQCAAGTAAALPVYATARRVAGPGAARAAAALLLLDPTLVAYGHLLWPETLFLLVVSLVFAGVAGVEARSRGRAAALGLATGTAMLLKPVFGLFAPLLALSWLRRFGAARAALLSLAFGATAALAIVPWVVRNQLRYGPTILLENQGPFNLWIGNEQRSPVWILEEWRALGDPATRSRFGVARGLAAIRDDPGAFLRRSVAQALNLWGFEFFAVRAMIFGGYGRIEKSTLLGAFWVLQLGWAVSLLLALLGARGAARDPALRLVLVYAAVFTAVVCTMVGTTRFRVPFAFLLAVSGGIGAQGLLRRRLTPRDGVAAFCGLMVLAHSAMRPIFRKIASGRFEEVVELREIGWFFFRY